MAMEERAFLECAYSEAQQSFERHFHNAYELVYIAGGRVLFDINGTVYQAGPHTILFISKLEDHTLTLLESPYKRYYILLTPQQLDRAADDPRLKSVFISRPPGFCHCFDMSACAQTLPRLFQAMLEEHNNPDSLSRTASRGLFHLLMVACYRTAGKSFPRPWRQFSRGIFDVQQYLDRHFAEDIRLDELAARFFISPSYLSHAFKEWTGDSPKQYLMRSRIAFAKELLITTDLPVTAVAVRCGFGDVSNFIRSFRRETGLTPLKYRLQ